ncbi:MAG: hypothetical protein GX665_12445 [Gammaproteobacteria bacterium]|nr:hypothetical protein [Gammaproteobacteria bacterium]
MSSIKERLIQVVLRGKDLLSPEAKKGKEALEALRSEGEKLRAELDKAKADSGMVKALDGLNKESARSEKALERARADVDQLREALDKAPGSKGLEVSLKAAESESRRAEKALAKLQESIKEQAAQAQKAGIDVSNLAGEEKRLAGEVERTKGAVDNNAKATRDLQKEQAAAARSAAEQESRTKSLREALSGAEKRVLGYAAAYISLKAAMSAVTGVVGFIRDGFTSVFQGAAETEQTLAQLNAALASTENAAGLTAEQLAQMGVEMRKSSMLSLEQITEMQTALLTYTDVAADEFPRALQIAIDQQQRLGISITQSAELVGKALQSPSQAMTALGRQGFKLEEDQKKLLKQFEDTGRMAEAQAIIMDMLAESYGGSAAAARYNTFDGLWKGIKDTFVDFQAKIADSGSFEYLKGVLAEVHDNLLGMANDGTLDNLAQAISDAFVQGAEKVRDFVSGLGEIDFKQISADSSAWLSDFGAKIDDAVLRVRLFFAPFSTLFNGVTSGIAMIGAAITALVAVGLAGAQQLAKAFDKVFRTDYAQDIERMGKATLDMFNALVEQINQDGQDIRDTWTLNADHAIDEKKREVEAAHALEKQKADAAKQAADEAAAAQKAAAEEAANAHRTAAIEGRRAIEDMADAFSVIDATSSVAELEKLRQALMQAGKDGKLSQQELDAALAKTNGKIKDLSAGGKNAAKDLTTLEGVMKAIKTAANNIDTQQARAALDKLYKDGKINADEHAKAQQALNEKVTELKPAAETASSAVGKLNADFRTLTSDVKDGSNAAEEAGGSFDYFGSVLSQAREPLANLSAAALDAFDAMQGISNAGSKPIDTSSYKGLRQAAEAAKRELGELRHEQDLIFNPSQQLANWALDHLIASKKIEAAALGQKARLAELTEQYQKGTISAKAFVSAANGLKASADLLDDSDLSALTGAINAAKQKMDQLADSTKGTLEQLNDELLQLKGTQEEIEASKMASRRRDLQSQLADARKDGDDRAVKNLQQALRTLSEIEDERTRQARNAKAEEAKKATEAQAQKAQQLPQAQQQAPQKVIRLEAPGGKAVNVAVGSDTDETALLGILESYARRTG